MKANYWASPNAFSLVLRCAKMKYAQSFLERGQIKLSTPESWVKYEEDHGNGRGDRLEGTLAVCHFLDIDSFSYFHSKYSHYNDLIVKRYGNHLYFKRKRDMQLPCFCLYHLPFHEFPCPEKLGKQVLKTSIPPSYFRDFADNVPMEIIENLPMDERPAIIFIEKYSEFKQRFIKKLTQLGVTHNEIIETNIYYRDFYSHGNLSRWDSGQTSPLELAIKHIRFKDQNELRFIINTNNPTVLELLKKPIEIGSLEDICALQNVYLYNGMNIELTADIQCASE